MTLTETFCHRHYRFDPADPAWPDRDRLVLPSDLVPTGLPDDPGGVATLVDGPPGLAFGAALGMAMAERLLAARFGRSLVDHRTWLLAGLPDLVAGTAQEAAMVAGALPLGRLAVLARLPDMGAQAARRRLLAGFTAAGWTVRTIANGDELAADAALSACLRSQKPTLIVEAGHATDRPAAAPIRGTEDDEQGLRTAAKRGPGARRSWLKRLRRHPTREAFQHAQTGYLPPGWPRHLQMEDGLASASPPPSPAHVIQLALGRLAAIMPELTGVPLRDVPGLPALPPTAFAARELAWDGLDQAAAAAALGMALHGGVMPLWWGPLHAESSAPALRAAARDRVRMLLIVPDGHAPPMAAIPDVLAFAPADAAEALDCLGLALRRPDGPAILAVPAQGLPRPLQALPRQCGRGAYVVCGPSRRDVTLLAAGAAVVTAVAVQALLAARQIPSLVVSMPCRALFDLQDAAYQRGLLGAAPVIALGAGDQTIFCGLVGIRDLILTQAAGEPPARVAETILRHLQRSPPAPEAE